MKKLLYMVIKHTSKVSLEFEYVWPLLLIVLHAACTECVLMQYVMITSVISTMLCEFVLFSALT